MSEENKKPLVNEEETAAEQKLPAEEVSRELSAGFETAAAEEEKAADARQAAIDEMEKASQKALDAMREQGNARNDEVVDEAETRLKDIFDDFNNWMKVNTNPDHIKEELEKVSRDTADLLNATKEKVIETANSEQFKSTMQAGRDFLTGTGGMISDGFKYGYDKLMEIPELKKVGDRIDEGVDRVRRNENLKDFVNYAEKGINDLNQHIFDGLKSFFRTDAPAESSEKKETLPDLPEQDKASTEE